MLKISPATRSSVFVMFLRTNRGSGYTVVTKEYKCMSIVSTLPHWDMTVVYPSMESQEFAQGYSNVVQDIDELARLFDTRHIGGQTTAPLNEATIKTFEAIVERFNAVMEATSTLNTYITCFITT